MARNHAAIPGAPAPGSRPSGSSAYPQAGKQDSLAKGGGGLVATTPTHLKAARGKSTINSRPS